MQKVLGRTAQAQRQAQRKFGIKEAKEIANRKRELRDEIRRNANTTKREKDTARRTRREDWVLGPLAPKRDVGTKENTYGCMTGERATGHLSTENKKHWGIVKGDRVVICKWGHRDYGKIGKVTEVRETGDLKIDNLNKVEAIVPEFLRPEGEKTVWIPYPLSILVSDVRLVAPLPDYETGTVRDVVIQELKLLRRTVAQKRGEKPPTRRIAGVSPPISIPYPKKADNEPDELYAVSPLSKPDEAKDEDEKEEVDHDVDCLRIEVEERTWVPTLSVPPMPGSVIDELRHKFSKFRTRHDEEWVARKTEEDRRAELEKQRSAQRMMTPLMELHAKQRAERRARGWPELPDEALARIGEVMERNMRPGELTTTTARSLDVPPSGLMQPAPPSLSSAEPEAKV